MNLRLTRWIVERGSETRTPNNHKTGGSCISGAGAVYMLQMQCILPQITHARHELPAPLLLGQAKVRHLETGNGPIICVELAIQQQVVWLQVKVHHTHLMEVS